MTLFSPRIQTRAAQVVSRR